MSGFNKNSDNREFIKKLELLRDLEAEKPVEEMDVSLVKACVELILELRGETVNFTPEEVEEKVRKIPFVEETTTLNTPPKSVKGRSTKVKSRKILLIAAIISILIAIFAVTSIAFDWNIFDELKNRFGTVANAPVNEKIDVDGITVISYGENKYFVTLEEFFKDEKMQILYLTEIPTGITLEQVVVQQVDLKEEIVFVFDDINFSYSVTFNKCVSDDIKNTSTEILQKDGRIYYITDMEDIAMTQICFDHNGDFYCLSYNNKQVLIETIENLKELQ